MHYDKTNKTIEEPWHSFWKWLLKGSGAKPGYSRLISKWLILDAGVAILFAVLTKTAASTISTGILIPLSGVFIAMITASMANTNQHITSPEFEKLYKNNDGGIDEYVYPYVLSALCFLTSIIIWGISATGIFDSIGFILILTGTFASSLSVRVSWKSLLGSAYAIFAIHEIREHECSQSNSDEN